MPTTDPLTTRVEQFLGHVVALRKSIRLYPPNSPMIEPAITKLGISLKALFTSNEAVTLGIVRDRFLLNHVAVGASQDPIKQFAEDLYRARVKVLRVAPAVDVPELYRFLTLLCKKTEDLLAGGGLGALMADLELPNITVEEAIDLMVVNRAKKPEQWDVLDYLSNRRYLEDQKRAIPAPQVSESGEIDTRDLADFFMHLAEGAPDMAQYLRNTLGDPIRLAETLNRLASAQGTSDTETDGQSLESLNLAFSQISEAISFMPVSTREAFAKNMAKALNQTTPIVKKELMEEILPEQLGRFGASDLIIASLENEAVAGILTNHVMFHSGTANTVDNFLSGISHERTRSNAITQKLDENLTQSKNRRVKEIAELLGQRKALEASDGGGPKPPQGGARRDQVEESIESVAQRLKLEPGEAETLRQQVIDDCNAITLSNVTETLLSLAGQEIYGVVPRHALPLLMYSLESNFERRRLDLVIRVLEYARAQEPPQPHGAPPQWAALIPDEWLQKVVNSLRFLDPISTEYAPTVQIVRLLGDSALESLFSWLATETNRATRMFLLRLFTSLGDPAARFLSNHIGHPDWYVVRNVAHILGKIGSPFASEALKRALFHSDARVRSEVVEALAATAQDDDQDFLLLLLLDNDSVIAEAMAASLQRLDPQRVLPKLRRLLQAQRDALQERPDISSGILYVFAKAGTVEDMRVLAQFRPSLLRFFSSKSRAIARDCTAAMNQIKTRIQEGA